MKRRCYIYLLGYSGLGILPGCAGFGSTDTPKDSPSPSEPEPTETPTPKPPSFNVVEIRAPESAELGSSFQIEIEVENNGGQSGTWEAELYFKATYGPEPDDWDINKIDLIIPPGESRTWRSANLNYREPAIVYFRLGEQGPLRIIEVPGSQAPIITRVNLISGWNSFGDVVDNQITDADAGDVIYIGFRYWYFAENQTYNAFSQVKIYNEEGDRVGIQSGDEEQVTEINGWSQWETSWGFDTRGWGPGTYTAEVLLRDNQNQKVSNLGTIEFRLA